MTRASYRELASVALQPRVRATPELASPFPGRLPYHFTMSRPQFYPDTRCHPCYMGYHNCRPAPRPGCVCLICHVTHVQGVARARMASELATGAQLRESVRHLDILLDQRVRLREHHKAKSPVPRPPCPVCGGPVFWAGSGRPPVYCGRPCKSRAYEARRRIRADHRPAAPYVPDLARDDSVIPLNPARLVAG